MKNTSFYFTFAGDMQVHSEDLFLKACEISSKRVINFGVISRQVACRL